MRSSETKTTPKETLMKHNMYTIFDTASGLYSHPVYEQSDKAAIRSFGNLAQNADCNIGQHPEDYTLFRVGIFDDNNGKLHNEVNESLATALECLAKTKNPDPQKITHLTNGLETNEIPTSI